MKKTFYVGGLLIISMLAAFLFIFPGYSSGAEGSPTLKAQLSGFDEVPSVSSTGSGELMGMINKDDISISYELSYSGLEGTVVASHIHLGQQGVNGGIIAFLCGGGGKPACPQSGTVTGEITAADVIGPVGQGIAAGELDEALRAIRSGNTYANVHTLKHPGGEIRGHIK